MVAVLTPDAPDVLSHVSVRARNMRVLFATCHEPEPLQQLKAASGKQLTVSTTAAGAVTWSDATESAVDVKGQAAASAAARKVLKITVPKWNGK